LPEAIEDGFVEAHSDEVTARCPRVPIEDAEKRAHRLLASLA